MEKKFYIFRNKEWAKADKVFTHYWTNEGKDFFDTVIQDKKLKSSPLTTLDLYNAVTDETEVVWGENPTEKYLEQFISAGYNWELLENTRYQRETVSEIQVQMNEYDFNENPVLFFKVVNEEHGIETDIPLYYYSYAVTQVSDQNYNTTSYTVRCKLDMWATYWCRMHSIMKNCDVDIEFIRKMCDRFIFNKQYDSEGKLVESQGFIIDYLRQPYLMRSGNYPSNLIVNSNVENFLTLEEWLFLNSGRKNVESLEGWISSTWLKWLENPYVGLFDPSSNKCSDVTEPQTSFSTQDIGKYQNLIYSELLNGFYDTEFNSNSKYRYLVCKVGNNTHPKSVDYKEESGKITDNYVKGMFKNFNWGYAFATSSNKTDPVSISGYWDETIPWTSEEEPGSYEFKKTLSLNNISLSGSGSVCIYWENFLIPEKYLRFDIESYEKIGESEVEWTDNVTWTNDLQLKQHRVILNSIVFGVEYPIVDLPTKSYVFDSQGDYVNVSLSINIMFTSLTEASIVLRLKFDKNYEKLIWPKIKVKTDNDYTINQLNITNKNSDINVESSKDGTYIDGETIMLIPFKKGKEEQNYIQWLNDAKEYGICMGDGSLLGMPINDIPPSVLALALRRSNDESDHQNIGDMLSIRAANSVECPLSLINFELGENEVPAIFTTFDHIPVVIASAPIKDNIYQCMGGNKFFNYLYDILTNDYLTNNTYYPDSSLEHGGNTKDVEPFLYGPQFWKWSYFIDASHIIELTAEKIDFTKLITKDWEVKLNVAMTGGTSYFLDISDIKNNKYPMSKLGVELISADPATFPHTTEAYNNWYQQNQLTKETSKNANEIANRYAMTGAKISAVTTAVASTVEGATAGMSGGGFISKWAGLGAGAGLGAIAGAAKAAGILAGTKNAIAQANEEWNNKWRNEIGNYYNSPSKLNPDGFTSGSLTYSPIEGANQNSYELFKTLSLSNIDASMVWYDISMNGYSYLGQCKYSDYNNRINFNVINCNLFEKYYIIVNYLKSKMFEISPLLSQGDAIESFMDKCKDSIRLFKCEYDINKMEEIVSGNIELTREWVSPYYSEPRTVVVPFTKVISDNQTTDWKWYDEYHWDENVLTKNNESYSVEVTYDTLEVTDWDDFKSNYSNVSLGNKGSNAFLSLTDDVTKEERVISGSFSINDSDFGPDSLNILKETSKDVSSIHSNSSLNNAIYVLLSDSTKKYPNEYNLQWNISIQENDGKTGIIVNLTPKSQWEFDGNYSDYEIKNQIYSEERYKKKHQIGKTVSRDLEVSTIDNTGIVLTYLNGEHKNNFYTGDDSNYVYDDKYGLKSIQKSDYTEYKINYQQINPNITTKEEFIDYYETLQFNVNSTINYHFDYPAGQSKKELKLIGGKFNWTVDSSGADLTQILCKLGDAKQSEGTPLIERTSNTISGALAGRVQYSGSSGGHGRAESVYGSLSTAVQVIITLYDSYLIIKATDISRVNQWGSKPVPVPEKIGRAWLDGLKDNPNKMYCGIGWNNRVKSLDYNINLKDVTFIPKNYEKESSWHMTNNLNNVIFVKKLNYSSDSIILRNKKEDD